MKACSSQRPIKTIGFFDSGVGGLTVAKAIAEEFPQVRLIYFADSIHLPYGNKSRENIIAYSIESTHFLISKKIDLLIVACNTASSVALPALHKLFPDLPICGVIMPGSKAALVQTQQKKIAVIGTLRTITSNAYRDELLSLEQDLTIYQKACPLLVPLIEEGWTNTNVLHAVLHEYLDPFISDVDVLILGCTHYPLIEKEFKTLFPHLSIVASSRVMVAHMHEHFSSSLASEKTHSPGPPISLYTNDLNETFSKIAAQFFEELNIILV